MTAGVRRSAAIAALVALTLIGTGCAGDDVSETTGTTLAAAPSADAYVRSVSASAYLTLDEDAADLYVGLWRPAVALRHAGNGDIAGISRFGGQPLLDPGTPWPEWHGTPLSFLMVLDLSEIAGMPTDLDLPDSGLLNFFYESDGQPTWGFDPADRGSWRVIAADEAKAVPVDAPPGAIVTVTKSLTPESVVTFPDVGEPELEQVFETDGDDLWNLQMTANDLMAAQRGPLHQVGGWPHLWQGSVWVEAQLVSNGIYLGDSTYFEDPRVPILEVGASDWQLLAQIDQDETLDWYWGDTGSLYFLIRKQDLAAGRFDRTWMILQTT